MKDADKGFKPEVVARLTYEQLSHLLACLLSDGVLFSAARMRLKPQFLNGQTEAGLRAVWTVALALAEREGVGFLFGDRAQAWNVLDTELKAYGVNKPDEFPQPFHDSVLGQDPPGFLCWLYSKCKAEEFNPKYGAWLLTSFLRERAVSDFWQQAAREAAGGVVTNVGKLAQHLADRELELTCIDADPVQSAAPAGWLPPQIKRRPTGIKWLDGFLRGGHAAPETYLLSGAYGAGKCLAKGTPVLMYDGSVRKVEDVRAGDQLMGPDSKPRRVLATGTGRENMYRVVPDKGDPYTVNESHILSLKLSPKRRGQQHKLINISVRDWLKKSAFFKNQHMGWRTGVEFDRKPVPVDPYYLGLWLGDGHASTTRMTNMEPEINEFQAGVAASYGLRLGYVADAGAATTYGIVRHGKGGPKSLNVNPLRNALRELGVFDDKHVPRLYLANSREVRLQVLAGLIDTDGHLSNNCYEYTTAKARLAEDVLFLARSLGLAAYRTDKWVDGALYHRVLISGHVDEIPVRVPRKKASPRLQKKDALVTGIRVEAVGEGEYFGFELDGDGLFLLGDFTVTHNTTFGLQLCVSVSEMEILLAASPESRKSIGLNPDDPYEMGHVYYFYYEMPEADIRTKLWSCAANIDWDRVKSLGMKDFALSTANNLSDEEKEAFSVAAQQMHVQTADFPGEQERLDRALKTLATNVWMIDCTGNGPNPGFGTGYVSDVASVLAKEQKKGRKIACVVIDYAQAMVDRHTSDKDAKYDCLSQLGRRLEHEVGVPFDTPVWILGQLSGQANERTAATKQHHSQTAGSKRMGENAWFAFNIGTADENTGCRYFTCSKARRADLGKPPILKIAGGVATNSNFNRLIDVSANYFFDGSGRVKVKGKGPKGEPKVVQGNKVYGGEEGEGPADMPTPGVTTQNVTKAKDPFDK